MAPGAKSAVYNLLVLIAVLCVVNVPLSNQSAELGALSACVSIIYRVCQKIPVYFVALYLS